jgi:Clostripain family
MSKINEWTVMFYFGGDNALSPVIVSELKAIKDAGFQEDTDVVVYFDPSEIGVPTRIYNVNRERKRDGDVHTRIGDGENCFVHNLEDDDFVHNLKKTARPTPMTKKMLKALRKPDNISAEDALKNFLGFCQENYRAKHYILFLVGHGMVVANDAFLPDENPVSGISLKGLEKILRDFTKQVVKKDGNAFELLALHSCSMSAIEVAYQLKGTAKYMMASEGTSFVNSWPYRQLLKKIFKTIKTAKKAKREQDVDVEELMEKLYFLSLFNAKDFMFSGYSLDLCLCSLEPEKFKGLKGVIQTLVARLKESVEDGRGQELILLAHWEAQSYWGESYTDLFDFCRCLRNRCNENSELGELSEACQKVMNSLKPIELKEYSEKRQREERFKGLVIRSDSFGSQYQYSHGLSVYFPWSRPVENVDDEDTNGAGKGKTGEEKKIKGILERYETEYAFTTKFGNSSWFSFLNSYFNKTQRKKTRDEEDEEEDGKVIKKDEKVKIDSSYSSGMLHVGSLAVSLEKPSPSSGLDCTCQSIKNYPEYEKAKKVRGKLKRNVKKVSVTEGASEPPKDLLE